MKTQPLDATAQALVAPGKGILAADESLPTIEKRFQSIGVPSSEETRRAYRELLCATSGLGEFISGIILFDETIRQKAADGTPLVEVLWPRFAGAGYESLGGQAGERDRRAKNAPPSRGLQWRSAVGQVFQGNRSTRDLTNSGQVSEMRKQSARRSSPSWHR